MSVEKQPIKHFRLVERVRLVRTPTGSLHDVILTLGDGEEIRFPATHVRIEQKANDPNGSVELGVHPLRVDHA